MAASQNGFCSYKLYIHKETNIIQIVIKKYFLFIIIIIIIIIYFFIYLIFYRREIVKQDHFMPLSLSYANNVRCKIHRFVAVPIVPARQAT